jgi:high-affinity Fe2+/Pb2+ permease
LLEAELIPTERRGPVIAPGRLLAGLLVALVIGALIVWLASEIAR